MEQWIGAALMSLLLGSVGALTWWSGWYYGKAAGIREAVRTIFGSDEDAQ